MKKPFSKAIFALLAFVLVTASKAECEGNACLYKAIIRTQIANVYERANTKTALVTQALLNLANTRITNITLLYHKMPKAISMKKMLYLLEEMQIFLWEAEIHL
jgi:hypothetical protein